MAADTLDQAKTKVTDAVDRLADDLEKISLQIHATPELCFHEEQAAGWLSAFLERQGARVEHGVGGLPTAFRATIDGSGPGPTIAIMAEYDALPNIGHACGHNVIATAGTGAGAAIAAALGKIPFAGRIQVIGTPAEEGGAGKVRLMEAGVFKDVDAAMMIHGRCGTQVWRPSLGIIKVKCEFFGKASHASSWPWRGVNALNAMIQLFVSLDQMRQQIKPEARIHGIITQRGRPGQYHSRAHGVRVLSAGPHQGLLPGAAATLRRMRAGCGHGHRVQGHRHFRSDDSRSPQGERHHGRPLRQEPRAHRFPRRS